MRPELDKPRVVVAHTVKGQGVSFMSNTIEWHYLRLNPELLEKALAELDAVEHVS